MKDIDKISIQEAAGGAILAVKVVPGASRNKIAGPLGACLKIAVAAPPEHGKANAAVAEVLARALGVPVRSVQLVSGPTNPRKEFQIAGFSAAQVREKLDKI